MSFSPERLKAAGVVTAAAAALAIVIAMGGIHETQADETVRLSIRNVDSPVTVYDWTKQHCEEETIPDGPARAFRRIDNKIVVVATDRQNWILVGDNISDLKPLCQSVLPISAYRPRGFGDLWIEAVYTNDGQDIVALLSQDFTPLEKAHGCQPNGIPGKCWRNNIIAAKSTDMGYSFALDDPKKQTVATLTDHYPPNAASRIGVFTTTNIVGKDDAYYMIAWVQSDDPKERGNCLFRTITPEQASTWRAWDGQGFDVDMTRPDGGHLCRFLDQRRLADEVRSLSYSKRFGLWIAVFASRQKLKGDESQVPGFYFATSKDLITWSESSRIMQAPTKARELQMREMYAYPSLIDPASGSRNFDTIDGSHAVLFFTVQHLLNGNGTLNRDLKYVDVEISRD